MPSKRAKSTHGGARKGGGRKPDGEKPKVRIMLTIDESDLAKLDRLTGNRSAWVAERIRKAREPKL